MSYNRSHLLRLLFVLPGLHRVHRGAEAAFENVARELALMGQHVTLMGSGPHRPSQPYHYIQVPARPRERFAGWPMLPPLRSDYRWEELSFIPGLWRTLNPLDYDLTLTCSYPFVNWVLRAKKTGGQRPPHIFVTENGDWPARRLNSEYKLFGCEGLICTNPEYYQRHRNQWRCALIPNGVAIDRFQPDGPTLHERLNLSDKQPVVLMVSALIPSKHVLTGIRAVARLPDAVLVLAGDGPQREACDALGTSLLESRYIRLTLPPEDMPSLYRTANLLLHLSREEAFGNIYIEAAACGRPVVTHDYATARWILEDLGIYADTASDTALDKALQETLGQPAAITPQQRYERMRARFAWPVVAQEYLAFARELWHFS